MVMGIYGLRGLKLAGMPTGSVKCRSDKGTPGALPTLILGGGGSWVGQGDWWSRRVRKTLDVKSEDLNVRPGSALSLLGKVTSVRALLLICKMSVHRAEHQEARLPVPAEPHRIFQCK